MKPSWKDAPEWAKYLAMDEDGTWTWFEEKPEIFTHASQYGSWVSDKRWQIARVWQETLEQRPE